MDTALQQQLPQIQQLMRHYGVERAFVFGSAAKGTLTGESDIDFLMEVNEISKITKGIKCSAGL